MRRWYCKQMKIKDMQKNERPRERLIRYGSESLSNTELLSIIIKNGRIGESATTLASEILNKCKNISNLKYITKKELLNIKGIGEAKASEILSTIELGRRIFIEKEINSKVILNSSKKIYEYNRHLFLNKKQEYFYCIYLNTNNEMIERRLLFMGTLNKSTVHPREIFKGAYLTSASSIVCMHNHPSGNVTPSLDDKRITEALTEIGRLQQIPILDHIIFSDNKYYSFYENSIIER